MIKFEFHSDDPSTLMEAPDQFLEQWEQQRQEAEANDKPVPPELTPVRRGKIKLRKKRTSTFLKATIGQMPNQGTMMIYFVRSKDHVFKVSCLTATQLYERFQDECRDTARTLRSLSKRNRARIMKRQLRVVEALPNEKLIDLSERSGNVWDLERTAAANGLDKTGDRLVAGQRIKVAVEERYRGAPKPEPDSASNGGD